MITTVLYAVLYAVRNSNYMYCTWRSTIGSRPSQLNSDPNGLFRGLKRGGVYGTRSPKSMDKG